MAFWRFLSPLKKLDWLLLVLAFLLAAFGLTALYSVGLSVGGSVLNFQKQIVFLAVGLFFLLMAVFFDYRLVKSWSWPIYFLAVALLAAVLFFGQTIRGTTGWFNLGWFNLQPVEIAKLALIIFLARYFSSRGRETFELRHVLLTGLAAGFFVFLTLLQPDLGSALVLLFLWLGLLLALGVKRSYLLMIVLLICLLVVAAWFGFLADYQKDRLITFFKPSADPLGVGYNVKQSIIAIGSGRLWGQGLSFGSQSQLKFLPESQTDFIFAVIAEELGLLGVVLVLLFWAVLFYRLIRAIGRSCDDFGAILIMGVIILLAIQVFVNIGANLGLMPITGISLPLMSYGGSGLIVFLVMFGLAESVIIRGR